MMAVTSRNPYGFDSADPEGRLVLLQRAASNFRVWLS
jgi:hypothetical protein